MKKLKIAFYALISLFSFYLLFGFFILPLILKDQAVKILDENLNAKSSIEKIEFNPILFNLKIHNFALKNDLKEDLIALKELELELGVFRSIEKRYLRIEHILLDEIFLNIAQDKDGKVNLASLMKPSTQTKEETKAKETNDSSNDLTFLVSKIQLKNADIDFESEINKEPYSLKLRDLNYTIYDLGTYENSLSSNNLKFKINENTNINIKGAFNISPFKAYGQIDLKDLKIKEILDFQRSFFNFEVNKNANLNLILNYNIDTTNEFRLTLHSDLLELNNVDLNQNKTQIASLKKLDIKRFDFDLYKQEINLSDINIDSLNANMISDKSGINFANLVNSASSKEDKKSEQKYGKPWIVNLENIKANANFKFQDLINNKLTQVNSIVLNTKKIKIIDSKIDLNNASLDTKEASYLDKKNNFDIKSSKTNIKLNDLSVNNGITKIANISLNNSDSGFFEKNSKLDIKSKILEASLKNLLIAENISFDSTNLKLSNLDFNDKNNKLNIDTKAINLDIKNFLLDKNGNIKIASSNLKNPYLHFEDLKNKLSINTKDINIDLKSFLFDKNSDISLDSMKLAKPSISLLDSTNNLKLDASNLTLDINKFKLKNSDISIDSIKLLEPNLDIFNLETNAKIESKNIDLHVKKIISKPNFFKIEKTDLINTHLSIILPKNISSAKEKKEQNKENINLKEETTSKFRLNIGPVDIKNMSLDFEDKNLALPFQTKITKLNGQISEIKSKDKSTSKLEVKGTVDQYGTAKITGLINPNNIKILTDINMKFQNIAMKNFTPYTAKFVGRKIKDGKLDLDLNYNIDESNLKAKNNIIIKKLVLGDKVQSADSVSLPLDLAISLLEDSSNTIDINLPISGNVDDPSFSVGAIIWKAFINLMTKAITAPFSLIGSLFNFSEEEIKNVQFDINESEITPLQEETLDKIAIILDKKEQFAIKFSPSFDEKNEKENIALERAKNIKEYLISEKSIKEKQVIISDQINKISSKITLDIEGIK